MLKAGTPQLRAICVNIALYVARCLCRRKDYVSIRDLSLGMVLKLQEWVGLEYCLVIVADAYYACREFIREVCKSELQLITRIRSDARIYGLPANPRKARRGRKRLYGKRIHLRRCARNLEKFIPPCEVFIYGKQHRVRVRKLVGRWFGICDVVSIVIVVGIGKKPVYLLDTDPQADPMETLKLYGARYAIEQQYADLKGQGGLGKYRGRREKGVRRFALLCVVAHSLLHLIAMSPRLCGLLPRVGEPWRKERSHLTIGQIRERIGRLYMKALVEGDFLNVALGHREQQNYRRASQVLQKAT